MADSEMEDDDEFVEHAGEEDEGGVGQVWIDTVFDDLETAHYSCGAIILPACGIGAPHIRLRTWFVAERSSEIVGDSIGSGLEGHGRLGEVAVQEGRQGAERYGSEAGGLDGMDNSNGRRCDERELGDEAGAEYPTSGGRPQRDEGCGRDDSSDAVGGNGLADPEHAERRQEHVNGEDGCHGQDARRQEAHGESGTCGEVLGMANSNEQGSGGRGISRSRESHDEGSGSARERSSGFCPDVGLADATGIDNQRDIELEGSSRERQGTIGRDNSSSRLADTTADGRGEERPISGGIGEGDGSEGRPAGSDAGSIAGRLDDSTGSRHLGAVGHPEGDSRDEARLRGFGPGREEIGLADPNGRDASAEREQRGRQQRFQPQDDLFGGEGDFGIGHNGGPGLQGSSPTDGFWGNPDWLFCRDGKWRPISAGTSALAHGLPRGMGTLSPELRRLAEMAGLDGKSLARAKKYRIGSLKGYGNAIVSDVAVEIIKAYMEHVDERD